MVVFEMVFGIVLVCAIAGVMVTYITRDKKHSEEAHRLQERYLSRIDDLEERIRVLEKIVTDKRFDLKRQIDSL